MYIFILQFVVELNRMKIGTSVTDDSQQNAENRRKQQPTTTTAAKCGVGVRDEQLFGYTHTIIWTVKWGVYIL